MGLGALACSRLGIEARPLSSLAYWVLGPAFVFQLFADAHLTADRTMRLVLAGLGGMAGAAMIGYVGARFFASRDVATSTSVQAATVMTASYGNVGNAGLAVSVFALGQDALPAAGVLMLTINIAGVTLGVLLASARSAGPLVAVGRAARTPMTVAAAIALACNGFNVATPLVINRTLELLSGAMIPVMLLSLGAQLVSADLRRVSPDISWSIVAKLVVAPIMAGAVAFGLGLRGDHLGVVIVQSSMPPAVFCLAVSLEHELETARVTTTLVVGTLMSLVTIPVVLVVAAS